MQKPDPKCKISMKRIRNPMYFHIIICFFQTFPILFAFIPKWVKFRCKNQWFRLDTTGVRRLLVNRYGLDRLRSHPYMDFYKAKAILEYRRKYGKIKGLSQLSLWKEFSEKDLKRLAPYLSFE